MSIKTIKQRIALVAVSALTAGMFTVVSAPVANATIAEAQTYFGARSLVIGTNVDTDGTPNVPTAAQLGSLVNPVALSSVGWVANTNATSGGSSSVSSIGTSTTGGISRTGVIQTGGKISFAATSAASANSVGVSVVVTGGTIGSLVTTSSPISLSGSQNAASVFINSLNAAGVNTLAGTFSVTGAAGSTATIAAYTGAGIIDGDTRTAGTLIAIWTLTIAAANSAGTVNLAESTVTQQPCITYAGNSDSKLAYDTASRCGNGRLGVVYVALKDTFTSAVTGGQLAATATGGAFVNVVGVQTTTSGDNYSATTAFDTTAATSNNYVLVTQPVANVGGSTTVTITYAGAVVGTKTITFAGDVASITVDTVNSATVIGNGVSSLTSGTSFAKNVVYTVKDAAGNAISGLAPTLVDATGAMLGATLSTSTDSSVTVASSSASLNVGYATINHPGGTATANFGAGSYKIQVLNAAGVAVKSNEVKVTVASTTTYSFTASFDKASYVPGDFATLTISAKDVFGNPMPTGKTMPGLVIAVSSGLTVAGAACDSASTFKAGVKTCTYAVGNTAGSYSWSVALTTATDQAPATGVVKNVDGAVSNAEVLKSIVALIASINKQIAALQKLILKR